MKTSWIAALVMGLALGLSVTDVDARRFGGGKSTGMQRATPDKPVQGTPATPNNPSATPNAPAAPTAAAAPTAGAAAAAAAPKRSWLGPVAGLAAGLGLAALFSHLGWGDELASAVMLALMVVAAIVIVRWLLRRFAGGAAAGDRRFAMAGAPGAGAATAATGQPLQRSALPTREPAAALPGTGPVAAPAAVAGLPADFDHAAFERIAKMIFIRMQAANDAGDLNDLRSFTTPEMFAAARLDLQERGGVAQKTDVVTVDAQLLDFAQDADRQIVSVRYSGLIREESDAAATPFDEVWHLVRPADGSREWAIAGIQQRQH